MSDQVISITVKPLWRRGLLLVPVVLALVCAWYVVRWCVGNTMAEWLSDPGAARAAARLAPSDPQPHFTLARLAERSFEPEQLAEAVTQYEQAAALSPHDYRLWLELGRARGLAGDDAGSERALRRAAELAPGYPDPHWYLGNLLLRDGRNDEAFTELRRAADANPARFRPQVFEVAWRMAQGNVAAVVAVVGDAPATRAGLIEFLLAHPADEATRNATFAEAAKLWQSLTTAERRTHRPTGEKLRDAFLNAKQYATALEVQRELSGADAAGAGSTPAPALEQLMNGGFESAVGPPGRTWYDWQVTPPTAPTQINLDERQRHSGTRSLRVVFNASEALDFRNVAQLVVVAPQTRYRLTYFVRAEDVKGASTVLTEVVAANDQTRVLVASAPLAVGTSDWREVALEFTTPPQTEAVVVRFNRPACPETLCPLFGKVWYDDFNLQRLAGGSAATERGRGNAAAASANAPAR